MKELADMNNEELLEVIRIKDLLIKDLRNELEAYQQLVQELQPKVDK